MLLFLALVFIGIFDYIFFSRFTSSIETSFKLMFVFIKRFNMAFDLMATVSFFGI